MAYGTALHIVTEESLRQICSHPARSESSQHVQLHLLYLASLATGEFFLNYFYAASNNLILKLSAEVITRMLKMFAAQKSTFANN